MKRYFKLGLLILGLFVATLGISLHVVNFRASPEDVIFHASSQAMLECRIEQTSVEQTRQYISKVFEGRHFVPVFTDRQLSNPLISERFRYRVHVRNNGDAPAFAISSYNMIDNPSLTDFGRIERAIIIRGPDCTLADDGSNFQSTDYHAICNADLFTGLQQITLPAGGELRYLFFPFNGLRPHLHIKAGTYTIIARYWFLAPPHRESHTIDSMPIDITISQEDIDEWEKWAK
jgi:hypothetical protein